jgi:hypothetical protein
MAELTPQVAPQPSPAELLKERFGRPRRAQGAADYRSRRPDRTRTSPVRRRPEGQVARQEDRPGRHQRRKEDRRRGSGRNL